jgi:hypothetical protein
MRSPKQVTIATAHRYSVIVSVFDSRELVPELATGLLIRITPGLVLVTAAHVVKRYLELGPHGRLQIGAHRFTLQNFPPELLRFSRDHDVASVILEENDLEPIGKDAIQLSQIASSPVAEGALVAFVGYPGQWKSPGIAPHVSLGYYEFYGPVRTVETDQFSILVEPRYEIRITTTRPNFKPGHTESLGGLSGAPVFSVAAVPQLVGWIYEGSLWSPADHKLFAIHAQLFTADGAWAS